MIRKSCILFVLLALGCVLCLTNGFADDVVIPEDILDDPLIEGPEQIEGILEFQRDPEAIFGSPDFEKMRDLPPNSQDYQLGRKVSWIQIYDRTTNQSWWSCTGFLVGPDLLMTNAHCLYDFAGGGRLRAGRVLIYMDYYHDRTVDPTRGGVTTLAKTILHADGPKDYVLLRLNDPIGNTYGWLELDTTTGTNTSQSVKLISHPAWRSKEIVRRNSQISDLLPDLRARSPFLLFYFADTEGGSSGSPVFLKDGTGVIAIHHSSLLERRTYKPIVNSGSLMSHIVPEIQQYLPATSPPLVPSPVATTLEVVSGSGQSARVNQRLANPLVVRVKDQNDVVMSGVSVSFSVAPSGTVSPSSATTGSNGEAETRLTLGDTTGTYTVTARVSGITQPVTFTATATAPGPLAFSPNTIAAQSFTVDSAIQPLRLPIATGGTAPYTYSLAPIPAGLSFSSAERLLSGTPTTAATATSTTYTARDTAGRSVSLTFTITVTAPLTFTPSEIAAQTFTVGTPVSLSLPIATGGTAPYTYSLAPIPAGLSFSSAERLLSGTPTTAATATSTTYTARDTAGRSVSLTFTITVTAPLTFTPSEIAAQTFTVGTPVSLSLPIATGGTAPYTYSLAPIPAGLSFSSATRILSGTPTTAATATPITYTVRDAAGRSASLTFTITVAAPPDLVVESPETSSSYFRPGESFRLEVSVRNQGTGPAPATTLRFYQSADSTITTSDVEVGTTAMGALASGGSSGASITLTAPVAPGTYDYGACVDAVGNERRTNNNCSTAVTITVRDPLDVNRDGQVTVIDLVTVALFYGTQVPDGISLPADVNADGQVNILDLTAVTQGIDAADVNAGGLSLVEVKAALAAAAEQAAEIEAIAEAPNVLSPRNLTDRNVAAALTNAKQFAIRDGHLEKEVLVVLEELLQLLREMKAIPEASALLPNYPNPFNPETWIPYHLATDAEVILTIYDVRGVAVRVLTLGHQPAGIYKSRGRAAYWDGKNQLGEPVASGVYFYTLTAGDFATTRKMLIRK